MPRANYRGSHHGRIYLTVPATARKLQMTSNKVRELMGADKLEWTQFRENGRLMVLADSILSYIRRRAREQNRAMTHLAPFSRAVSDFSDLSAIHGNSGRCEYQDRNFESGGPKMNSLNSQPSLIEPRPTDETTAATVNSSMIANPETASDKSSSQPLDAFEQSRIAFFSK